MKTEFYNRSMFYGANAETLRAAAILRKNMTLAELLLWKKLKDRKVFNTRFRRQHPVNMFIVDFYCHEFRLVIEIDDEIHNDKELSEYDMGRTAELDKFGVKVIRFTNDEVKFSIDQIISRIQEVITELAPLQGGWGAKNK